MHTRSSEAGRLLARAAPSGHEHRDQRQLKIRVLNVSKRELTKDLAKAVEFDQSQLFKKIYENEFGTPGGEPYGALIGDYEWNQASGRCRTLRYVRRRGGGLRAVHFGRRRRQLFGFNSWTELSKPRDLAKIFESTEYTKWRSFRDTEDSRFVSLDHAPRRWRACPMARDQADRRVRL
jgi:type VI secretion system protein ImpC